MTARPNHRRRLLGIVALAAALGLTLALWWYVAGSPSGQSCVMVMPPVCTDQPHKVGFEDWALAIVSVGLVGAIGLATIRRPSSGGS